MVGVRVANTDLFTKKTRARSGEPGEAQRQPRNCQVNGMSRLRHPHVHR